MRGNLDRTGARVGDAVGPASRATPVAGRRLLRRTRTGLLRGACVSRIARCSAMAIFSMSGLPERRSCALAESRSAGSGFRKRCTPRRKAIASKASQANQHPGSPSLAYPLPARLDVRDGSQDRDGSNAGEFERPLDRRIESLAQQGEAEPTTQRRDEADQRNSRSVGADRPLGQIGGLAQAEALGLACPSRVPCAPSACICFALISR